MLVEKPVEGRQRRNRFEKSKTLLGEKIGNAFAGISQLLVGMDFITEIRTFGEFSDGNNKRIGIGAVVGQVIEKLLSNLFNLLIAATKINLQHCFVAVERWGQDYVMKAGVNDAPILSAFGQENKLVPVKEWRQLLIKARFKRGERHECSTMSENTGN